MSIINILTLFLVIAALAMVPSASVGLVVVRTISAGFANGCAVAAGIVVGDLVFVFLALMGMAALSEIAGSFFLVLRYLAGAYLIWFGFSLIKSESSFRLDDPSLSNPNLSTSFMSGLFLTLGDIKAIFFYASLFPNFVELTSITSLDIGVIALLTIISVGGVKLSYVYFAKFVAVYAVNLRAEKAIKITTGSLMVGTGSYLISKV